MSASVNIFNPLPIISKPFIGTLNQRESKGINQKKNRDSFLVSAAPENSKNIKYAVLTVQGQGIYLNNIINQNNVYSWSVSPNVRFTCPAIYIKENIEHEKVIAVIEDDLEISSTEKKKTIWIWDLLNKDEDGMINKIVKKVKKPVSFLKTITFDNDEQNSYILSFNVDSSLTLYSPNFEIIHNHKGPGGICCYTKIIDVDENTVNIIALYKKDNEIIVRNSSINKSNNISINLKKELTFNITENTEALSYEYNNKSNSVFVLLSSGVIMKYSLDNKSKKGELLVNISNIYFQLNNSRIEENAEGQIYNGKFSMTLLNSNLIALIGKRGNTNSDFLTVWDLKFGTLQFKKIFSNEKWEEITSNIFEIESTSAKSSNDKYYKISSLKSDDLGDMILLTSTEITEKNPTSFKTNIYMFPFHCQKVNLLMALGKKSTESDSNIKLGLPTIFTPEINKQWNLNLWLEESNKKVNSDQEEFEKLMNSDGSKFEANYNKYLIKHKVVDDEKQEKKNNNNINNEKSLLDISQAVVNSILLKCFADQSKNWPKNVVASLLINNMVSSYLMNKNFISSILKKDELQLLEISLNKVRDINENDLVLIIRYICGDEGNPEWKWKPVKTRLANLKKFHKRENCYIAQELINEENGEITAFDFISTSGTQYLLEKVLMYPRNVPIFKTYLKQLNSSQLEAILPYLIHLLMDSTTKDEDIEMSKKDNNDDNKIVKKNKDDDDNEDENEDEGKDEDVDNENKEKGEDVFIEKITWLFKDKTPCNMAGIKVDTVVETISNIIDVNLTNTLLSEKLQKQLKTLRKYLGRTTHQYNQIQNSLTGPLSIFSEKAKYIRNKSGMGSSKTKAKHNTKRHYKNKILSQWNEAVEYTAEVLQF
ncbi:hypothetical protein BCR32DRAFT_265677 [Anaeromyces robustus]|uniref:Uncharacterized protein n=1 Tax=Anaeromyces robustus TaxID=1754192 RepID=A0A1Y1XI42_9FUNG|nr:hypothetical protein BCR32DRAFT_265677 [Anaeromyces robustus]|eukprot:ORX85403.1 hypothetical protein BCR32DRAFT_265677 [Anaeromyces robustus]